MLLAAGARVGYAVYKHEKKKKEERRRAEVITQVGPESPNLDITPFRQGDCEDPLIDDHQVRKRIVLASLINGMYARASSKPDDCSRYWELYHYELVPLSYILTNDDLKLCQQYLEKEEKYKYFGILRKKNTGLESPEAPEWVVAIRGTSKLRDVINDVKIALERLHTASTIELLKIVVSRLVKFVDPADGSKVVITGHSLGASKAMMVARELALQGYLLDSHFFNPPFATINALGRKWLRKFFAPILAVNKGRVIKDKINKIELELSVAFNFLLDGGERMKKQLAEYRALSRWTPYLYLNENDPVCDLYIQHFSKCRTQKVPLHENIDTWYSLGSALLKATLGDSETFHLMPRAVCCIAQTGRHRWMSAHSLDNWSRDDVPMEIKVPNLVAKVNEETREVTLRLTGYGLEENYRVEDEEKLRERERGFRQGEEWIEEVDYSDLDYGDWQHGQSVEIWPPEADLLAALPETRKMYDPPGTEVLSSLEESNKKLQGSAAAEQLSPSTEGTMKLNSHMAPDLLSCLPESCQELHISLAAEVLSSLRDRSKNLHCRRDADLLSSPHTPTTLHSGGVVAEQLLSPDSNSSSMRVHNPLEINLLSSLPADSKKLNADPLSSAVEISTKLRSSLGVDLLSSSSESRKLKELLPADRLSPSPENRKLKVSLGVKSISTTSSPVTRRSPFQTP